MKKHVIAAAILVIVVMLLDTCAKKQPPAKFSFLPEKPQPGERIAIRFDPARTALAGNDRVEAVAYAYAKGQQEARSLALQKKDNLWTADLETKATDRGIVLKFLAGSVVESDGKKGYVIFLGDSKGNPVPGAEAGLAEALGGWGTIYADLARDQKRALDLFEKDFAAHPEIKREFLASYLGLIVGLKKEDGERLARQEIDTLAKSPDLTVKDLNTLYNWSFRLKDTQGIQKYAALIRERDPQGEFVQGERLQEFYAAEDIPQKTALLEKFIRDYPESELIPQLHYLMVTALAKKGQFRQAKAHLDKYRASANWTCYSQLAADMANANAELGLAEILAAQAAERIRQEEKTPTIKKPPYLTDQEWAQSIRNSLGHVLSNQGNILLKLGKNDEALKVLDEAVTLVKGDNPDTRALYVEAMAKAGDPAQAMAEAEKILASGAGTARIKDILRVAYARRAGSEQGFADYLSKVEASSSEKILGELKKQMIDLAAPDFRLEDLQGRVVTLADIKGKVVVIDFWATWCPPCLASFPAVKTVVDKYAADPNVQFLFIDTAERVENKKQNAADFLTKTRYPFRVLLDNDSRVLQAYRVEGIPTRFVLDRDGRIRFRKAGYDGRADRLVQELSLMIESLR